MDGGEKYGGNEKKMTFREQLVYRQERWRGGRFGPIQYRESLTYINLAACEQFIQGKGERGKSFKGIDIMHITSRKLDLIGP